MPINEITKHIYRYDNSSKKIDEIDFITGLAKYYHVSKKRYNKQNERGKKKK